MKPSGLRKEAAAPTDCRLLEASARVPSDRSADSPSECLRLVPEAPLLLWTGSANSSLVLQGLQALLPADQEPLVGEQPASPSQQQSVSRWGAGGGESLDSRTELLLNVLLSLLSGVELLDFLLQQGSKLE